MTVVQTPTILKKTSTGRYVSEDGRFTVVKFKKAGRSGYEWSVLDSTARHSFGHAFSTKDNALSNINLLLRGEARNAAR